MNISIAMVKNLIMQLDMQKCLENSFKNHHAKGLNYINIYRDPNLTIKLYFLDENVHKNLNSEGLLVMPHTHAYHFHTQVLYGSIRHVIMEENALKTDHTPWQAYNYDHKQSPEDRFSKSHVTGLVRASDILHKQGENYYVDPYTIHSLIPTEKSTCLILYQFANERTVSTEFYLPIDRELPQFDGIYERFTQSEAIALLSGLIDRLEVL